MENINNLLITSSESGVSDACEEFDSYLTEKGIQRPVVLLSDGHSSRFDYDGLKYLLSKEIWLFISPPDTTGVTQLLAQVNKNLHHEYQKAKSSLFNPMQNINREAFMTILGDIWPKWAEKSTLVSCPRRVGITSSGLSVNFMQQDKFDRAAACIQEEILPSTSTPDSSIIMSPSDKRKGSRDYWKFKFYQAQSLIREVAERSIQLEEIPGLLTIKKVKPNEEKKATPTTRVTQVHGSMRAKDIAAKVKEIRDEKLKKQTEKEEAKKKKEEMKETFIKCKTQCTCLQRKCLASGLKQCPICLNVLRSVCSKISCKVNGIKPLMILPAKQHLISKQLFADDSSSENEDEEFESEESVISEDETDEESDVHKLKNCWKGLAPPTKETEVIGRWYAAIFATKRTKRLYVGRLLKRFLKDEDGDVDSIQLHCLKPKVGSGTVLEDTPDHLPDISIFPVHDVIAGPLNVIQIRGEKMDIPDYDLIEDMFHKVSGLNRLELFNLM